MVNSGDVVLECGSHHGYTTLLLASWVGEEGKVFAFEASRYNFKILTKNIEINQLNNLTQKNLVYYLAENILLVNLGGYPTPRTNLIHSLHK